LLVLRASPVDGSIVDPYSGRTYASIDGLDLDHVVPLGWAWDHGACRWPTQLRIMLATDVHNLVFTAASLNRSKSDQGPETWLPAVDPCGYWTRFQQLVDDYRLEHEPVGYDGHTKACPTS
jgi:CRISPR/Cas system Type II protein with McrA/HNH and RuvC-like nuclease domain